VIEFLFMADPPMMFWHTAAALGQNYWMLPVPHSFYMQRSMEVPVGEVLDILQATLRGKAAAANACPPGKAGPTCTPCPAGSYAYNAGSAACKRCFPGR
jgi:Tyrosine-protein kinase ephrin type A/B receptor-like